MQKDQVARFWERVDKRGPDECWLWMGSKTAHGYGQFMYEARNRRTHRLSWELHNCVPAPGGLSVCHRCDNPPCVNPAHLYVGTQAENIREARDKGRLYNHYRDRTHCAYGHALTELNTAMRTDRRGNLFRQCRVCKQEKWRAYKDRNRLSISAKRREYKRKNKDRLNAQRRARRALLRDAASVPSTHP